MKRLEPEKAEIYIEILLIIISTIAQLIVCCSTIENSWYREAVMIARITSIMPIGYMLIICNHGN